MEDNKITITSPEGKEEVVELITELETEDKKRYLVYTTNKKIDEDNIEVYISRVNEVNGEAILEDVSEDEFNDIAAFLDDLGEEE